jgi:hypothetical protein
VTDLAHMPDHKTERLLGLDVSLSLAELPLMTIPLWLRFLLRRKTAAGQARAAA